MAFWDKRVEQTRNQELDREEEEATIALYDAQYALRETMKDASPEELGALLKILEGQQRIELLKKTLSGLELMGNYHDFKSLEQISGDGF